jgi:hypothetical protein
MSAPSDASQFVGRWGLTDYLARDSAGHTEHPFGEAVEGAILYTEGGWMAVQIAGSERPALAGASDRGAARAAAFASYIAYAGPYRVEGDEVVHTVELGLIPDWRGGEQRRYYTFSDDRLLLRTPPITNAGRTLTHELHWARAQ